MSLCSGQETVIYADAVRIVYRLAFVCVGVGYNRRFVSSCQSSDVYSGAVDDPGVILR